MEIKKAEGCRNKWSQTYKPNRIKPIIGIVIHHTATFSDMSTVDWFTRSTQNGDNQSSSAHFLIGRDGLVWQFVDEGERAWHAGVSEREICGVKYKSWNEFSLGIELTGDGNIKPYTQAQYTALIALLSAEVNRFNVRKEFVVGHEQIAPGRKTDPGRLFDWERVYHGVYDELTPGGNSPANFVFPHGMFV